MQTDKEVSTAGLVSIGVPVFNSEHHVTELLSSLINQSYKNVEIIVFDNASTDDTYRVCKEFSTKHPQVRVFQNDTNSGPTENFNKVFSFARGEYFMWAAADDLFDPGYVQVCVEELDGNKELVLAGSETVQIYEDKDQVLFVDHGFSLVEDKPEDRFRHYRQALMQKKHIGMIFYGVYRHAQLEQALPMLNIIGSDHLVVAKLALMGKIRTVPRLLSWKRTGGFSRSFAAIAQSVGMNNRLLIRFPFLTRERAFQKAIWQFDLGFVRSLRLSLWSATHFFVQNILAATWLWKQFRQLCSLGLRETRLIYHYRRHGWQPWSLGYTNRKDFFLERAVNNPELLARFMGMTPLPDNYGYRLDERVVEYLWVFSRLQPDHHMILDAGSALNFPYLIESPTMENRKITICTLAPESNHYKSARVSYVYDDLRGLMFKDNQFDAIISISTIEHVGLDNTQLYTQNQNFKESTGDYLCVVDELKRVLKPGGKLLITVPFGKKQQFNWLQQFDLEMVNSVIKRFNGSRNYINFFRYKNDGWQYAEAIDCVADEYFDVHSADGYTDDYLAAARSVACIELIK